MEKDEDDGETQAVTRDVVSETRRQKRVMSKKEKERLDEVAKIKVEKERGQYKKRDAES